MALTHEDKLQIAQAVQLQLENADGSSGAMRSKPWTKPWPTGRR